jgi:hypothetical protein
LKSVYETQQALLKNILTFSFLAPSGTSLITNT